MIDEHTVCKPAPDVIANEVDGEWILVPVNAQGIGNANDALYTLNETGRWLWNAMDGKRTLGEIADAMTQDFQCAPSREERITEIIGWATSMMAFGLLDASLP